MYNKTMTINDHICHMKSKPFENLSKDLTAEIVEDIYRFSQFINDKIPKKRELESQPSSPPTVTYSKEYDPENGLKTLDQRLPFGKLVTWANQLRVCGDNEAKEEKTRESIFTVLKVACILLIVVKVINYVTPERLGLSEDHSEIVSKGVDVLENIILIFIGIILSVQFDTMRSFISMFDIQWASKMFGTWSPPSVLTYMDEFMIGIAAWYVVYRGLQHLWSTTKTLGNEGKAFVFLIVIALLGVYVKMRSNKKSRGVLNKAPAEKEIQKDLRTSGTTNKPPLQRAQTSMF